METIHILCLLITDLCMCTSSHMSPIWLPVNSCLTSAQRVRAFWKRGPPPTFMVDRLFDFFNAFNIVIREHMFCEMHAKVARSVKLGGMLL